MQMTFRWYGEGNDSITQDQIKQIPGVTGLVWALHDKQPGEVWEIEEIEGAADNGDEVSEILAARQNAGKPGAVRKDRSILPGK